MAILPRCSLPSSVVSFFISVNIFFFVGLPLNPFQHPYLVYTHTRATDSIIKP